jgi:hypothetical protein
MLDDDMVFTAEHVIDVLKCAYETGRPTSACYVLSSGNLAARRKNGKWSTGLGFLAIPAKILLELGDNSETFQCPIEGAQGVEVIEFTQTRITKTKEGKREWQGEDFVLCERLGGVNLAPICVGHLKQRVLQASQEHIKGFLAEQEKT